MSMIVRVYSNEDIARQAARALSETGFPDDTIALISSPPGIDPDAARVVRNAIDEGRLPGSYVRVATRAISAGQSIVTIEAPFGRGQIATDVLARFDPVATEELPRYAPDNPAPLSDFLGIPTLTEGRPDASDMSYWSNYHLFGEPRITSNPAPLSSRFGMKLLTESKRDWRSSLGLPLLSKNPAPLSSLLRMKTLSKEKPWRRSFGLPLLSKNPAPLSSMLSLPLLTGRRKKRKDPYRRS